MDTFYLGPPSLPRGIQTIYGSLGPPSSLNLCRVIKVGGGSMAFLTLLVCRRLLPTPPLPPRYKRGPSRLQKMPKLSLPGSACVSADGSWKGDITMKGSVQYEVYRTVYSVYNILSPWVSEVFLAYAAPRPPPPHWLAIRVQ